MKCKTCGSRLLDGTKKCPYCGAVQTPETKAESSFNWNLSDFPQQRKKHRVDIDWSAGKIFDRESGQVYDQSENAWSEPEDVKGLFSFDQKNEEYQELLDRQVEMITDVEPAGKKSADRPADFDFDLPSSMDMGLFSSLINDDAEISLVSSDGEITRISPSGEPLEDEPVSGSSEEAGPEALTGTDQAEITAAETEPGPAAEDVDPLVAFTEKKAAEKEQIAQEAKEHQVVYETPVQKKADTYTPEDEDRVSKGLKKLLDAEEQFRSDMERAAYITPEESLQAERVVEKSKKLTFVPTVAFRTIEDEYAAYCDENGIQHKVYTPAETEPKQAPAKKASGLMSSWRRKKSHDDNKEVEIKINEPSGTQVTVKTQEISLARNNGETDKATREVDLDEVLNAPKNVQVSVEVSAGQGNASVEVTRTHDGATLVKTVDNSQEPAYVDENADTREISLMPDTDITVTEAAEAGSPSAENTDTAEGQVSEEASAEETAAEPSDTEAPQEEAAGETEKTSEDGPAPAEVEEQTDEPSDDGQASSEESTEDDGSDEGSETDQPEDLPSQAGADPAEEAGENDAEASEEAGDETAAEDEKNKNEDGSFWERSDKVTRMTITDIFGPEARKILDQIDKAYNGDEKEAEEDLKKSLILDINPEDIQITAEQTAALRLPREERKSEPPLVSDAGEDHKNDADAIFSEIQSVEDAGISSEGLEKTRAILKAEKAIEKEAARQKKKREKLQRKQEKKAKSKHRYEENGTDKAEAPDHAAQTAITEPARSDKPAHSDKEETSVKTAEKKHREKKRETKDDTGRKGLSKPAKIIVFILMILLIAEFSIIGIKLYAGDSQVAIFIDKVEENIASLISGDDAEKDTEPVQDQQPADVTGGELAPPADTSVPEDMTGTEDTDVPA